MEGNIRGSDTRMQQDVLVKYIRSMKVTSGM